MGASKDALLVVLLVVVAAGGAYLYNEYQHRELDAARVGTVADALILPNEIKLVVGEPKELRADTRGKRVYWMALDPEIQLRPQDSKSVWVWGMKPGTYRITAWSAVNGLPTPNANCTVKVEAEVASK
jgi:hypothetical protein